MGRICCYFLFLFLIFGCSTTEPCEENTCSTLPPAVIFEIVEADTGENLFSNGTLKSEDIKLLDQNNHNVEFQFSEDNSNLLYLKVGWETGTNFYRLILGPEVEIIISLNSEKREDNCCSFYVITDLLIQNYHFEKSATTGNYIIFLD